MYQEYQATPARLADVTAVSYTIQLESKGREMLTCRTFDVALKRTRGKGWSVLNMLSDNMAYYNKCHREKAVIGKVIGKGKSGKTEVLLTRYIGDGGLL